MRLILFFLVIYCLPSYGQKDYDSIRNIAPREKLYVHFDKSIYTLADTIWFKAYLTDASTHTASPLSGLIYTELINPKTGEIMHDLSLPVAMGLTWGSYRLNAEKYKTGTYIFRAYTNWMQNFGEPYFFKKEIKVVSLLNEVKDSAKKIDTSLKQKLQEIDIQFLPEGGRWVTGISQRIAFKAIDANGKGIAVKGEIIDGKQHKITNFQSNSMGMGYVNIFPTIGESYAAMVNYKGLVKHVELPRPQQNGTILQVNNPHSKDSIKVTVYTNILSNQDITILGQSRGQLCFTSKIRFNTTSNSFTFQKLHFQVV